MLIGAAIATAAPATAFATLPGRNGVIAWVNETCPTECEATVDRVEPDGHGFRTVDSDSDALEHVAFSPDGRLLASDFNFDIRVATFARLGRLGFRDELDDETAGRFLVRSPRCGQDSWPRWSANGRELLFVRDFHDCFGNDAAAVYVARLSGGKERRVGAVLPLRSPDALEPDWSARGEIAFQDGSGLARMNSVGRRSRRVTSRRQDREPSWSPNGRRLVFTRYTGRHRLCGHVQLVRREGTGLRRLIKGCAARPVWSPDGASIAVLFGAGRFRRLEIVRANDGAVRRLPVTVVGGVFGLDWQPLRPTRR